MGSESGVIQFRRGLSLEKGKYPGFNPRTTTANGIRSDFDVAVTMRDGITIYIDMFRPENGGPYPVLIAWAPYGKHGRIKYSYFPHCGVSDQDLSAMAIFEAADPKYWCALGYAVIYADPRGAWGSEGDLLLLGNQEAEDCYDLIEWAGIQPWSNGKIGMHGVSYLAWSQWKVAALNPPHLAAINPWEGVSDFYRELAFHGGIPETAFLSMWHPSVSFSNSRVEDLVKMADEHPLFDGYWQSKNADLSKIEVPCFAVASWADHGLHARGTLEGFTKIASKEKWLMIHGRKKWENFYQNAERQKQFFDMFLKGIPSEVQYWPKVLLEVRERYYLGNFRKESEWPLPQTEYKALYLDAVNKALVWEPPSAEAAGRYNAQVGAKTNATIQFDHKWENRTELVGHMNLKVWVETDGGEDMDLFVALQKIDRTGDIVPFQYLGNHEDGPVALGWLRVSHRELDQALSTSFQPVHTHRHELKLHPGEIVPVEIEIWPSGTLFEAGETLRVVIQGRDIYTYPDDMNTIAHAKTVNSGEHVIHTGGRYDSHLLVPVIPQQPLR
ncbi:MAG: CocE/NonD family hydrolase [Acidimicrobiaceae bacterium]|nr:CocE/NonD family hydrolase [Acidimicrobiaceae bacterium]